MNARSFPDAERGEEAVEHLLVVHLAGDVAVGGEAFAEVAGEQLGGGGVRELGQRVAQRGLRAVEGLQGLKRRILVYRGTSRLVTSDGIEVWPVRHFLEALGNDRLWP